MKQRYLEAGRIIGTHGVRGMVRIQPWCDSAAFLTHFRRLYIDGEEFAVTRASVQKDILLCQFRSISDLDAAVALRGKIVYINRSDAHLEKGRYFVQDLIGLEVFDVSRGLLGKITEVVNLPSNDFYVVCGDKTWKIPAVPEFIKRVDIDGGRVDVSVLEGMDE